MNYGYVALARIMDMQNEHASWISRIDMHMQHGDKAWSRDMKYGYAALVCKMGMQNEHATWTIAAPMQHGRGYAA